TSTDGHTDSNGYTGSNVHASAGAYGHPSTNKYDGTGCVRYTRCDSSPDCYCHTSAGSYRDSDAKRYAVKSAERRNRNTIYAVTHGYDCFSCDKYTTTSAHGNAMILEAIS